METVIVLSVLCVSGVLGQCSLPPFLIITAPKTMEALSGSCLMIPCNFSSNPNDLSISTPTTYGVWLKNYPYYGQTSTNVIYNSSGTVTTYPMNITGNLSQGNCTTLFSKLTTTYTDIYYFRIEKGAFRASALCNPLQINVRDSLVPNITVPGDLTENVSVTITCSAFTPCPHFPPKVTWNLQQDSHNHREGNTDGTFMTKIQETITLSDQDDGHNISCSASYPVTEGVKTAETVVNLSVSYAPKDTSASVSPSASVSAGSRVNLTCSSRAKPPVGSFTWFQIRADGSKAVSKEAVYTFNATGGGDYYCVASNGLGNQASPQVHLVIGGVEKLLPLDAVVEGTIGVIVLLCVVVVTWYV